MNLNFNFWQAFFRLVHVYAGIFIAPFIFIAALTGLFYAATPQIEQLIYSEVLYVDHQNHSKIQPLRQQIETAKQSLSSTAQITEVRPSAAPNQTTRVIFSDPKLKQDNEAVFVDPYTLEIKGQLAVYGTSGLLPFRTTLDHLHRDLLLGNWGRFYSELAASWLAILILTGLYQWIKRRKILENKQTIHNKLIQKHSMIGLFLFPLLLFIAITGLTWSEWAGENIRILRQSLSWQTPTLVTSLKAESLPAVMMHHGDHVMTPHNPTAHISSGDFDTALAIARQHGIDASQIQIKPPSDANQAWTVSEIQRRWPTQADSIAIDMQQHQVLDQLYFQDYPLIAKLTRWGVDAHIVLLFGWMNQLILIIYALALCSMIIYAYLAWYKRTDLKQTTMQLTEQSIMIWTQAALKQKIALFFVLSIMAVLLPLLGISILVAIVVITLKHVTVQKSD